MCGICGKLDQNTICRKCKLRLEGITEYGIDNYQDDEEKYFDEHMYIFKYYGKIRNAILDYKFSEKTYIYQTFINFLKNNEKMCVQIKKYDIIMSVPISKKRKIQRGYNQSSIIAKKIAKFLNITYYENILVKKIDNKPQSTLNGIDRKENVKGVYDINKRQFKTNIKDKRILLVDDIFTTGSTVNECSKILRQADANKIGVFTIAKD